jgi:hypothetical protein
MVTATNRRGSEEVALSRYAARSRRAFVSFPTRFDVRGLLRAAWTNLRAGRVRQGGSTPPPSDQQRQ